MTSASEKAVAGAAALEIEYFSDVLCIWAYGAQVRIDTLKKTFPGEISLHYRFIPLFGAVKRRIDQGWRERGGFAGFNRHCREVAAQWDHVQVHERVWLGDPPATSILPQLFLKAVQLTEAGGMPAAGHPEVTAGRTVFEEAVWRMRLAFFRDGENICAPEVHRRIATDLGFDYEAAKALMDNGQAFAALHQDEELRQSYQVPGSPTLVFNQGRQRLYGNIGYRIIEANVREVLRNPLHGEASWC